MKSRAINRIHFRWTRIIAPILVDHRARRRQVQLIHVAPRGAKEEQVGGASRDRTDDLLVANQSLSQLSYGPYLKQTRVCGGGSGRSCTSDLTLIRGAL